MKTIRNFLGLCAIACMAIACQEATAPSLPPTPGTGNDTVFVGNGSKANPYTVGDVISMNPSSTTAATKAGVWVKGYVVGYYDNNANPAVLSPSADSITVNIMLCETATGATLTNTVCVQLPAGAIRDSLNIYSNLELVGQQLYVYGDIMKFNTLPGVKNTSGYFNIATQIGIDPPEVGSFDVPEMSIADLRRLYQQGSDLKLTQNEKIVGVVVTSLAGGNSTSLKNLVVTDVNNSTGIVVRFTDHDNTYPMNQKVEILLEDAILSEYGGALQLQVAQIRTQPMGMVTDLEPHVLTLDQVIANFETYKFTLVQTEGTISNSGSAWVSNGANTNHTLTSGSSEITLFIAKYANFKDAIIPSGDQMVTGILQNYNTTKQIVIRDLNDVVAPF